LSSVCSLGDEGTQLRSGLDAEPAALIYLPDGPAARSRDVRLTWLLVQLA
jgi:hypothetical protein